MHPHPPKQQPLGLGLDALPVRSMLLVAGIVAAVGILMAMVAMAYQPSRLQARVNNEAVFLTGAAGHLRAVLGEGNYRGAEAVWKTAFDRQEDWTQSPNQHAWSVVPVALNGTFPVACGPQIRCSAMAFQYDYRGSRDMDPKECQHLLLALNADFEVLALRRGGMTEAIAQGFCDRDSPSAPALLSIVAR